MPSWPFDPERFTPRRGGTGKLVIFLNGILSAPGDQFGWTDRAERFFLERTDHDVDSFEYFASPLLGRLGERKRLGHVVQLLSSYYAEWHRRNLPRPELHLVAHSRGCELARRLIVECGYRVHTLHLFAAAVDPDFEGNGLNHAMSRRALDRIRLYTSRGDGVLRWIAGASFGLYGRLGYTGPRSIAPELATRIRTFSRDELGHSAWFDRWNFTSSMEMVAADLDDLPL